MNTNGFNHPVNEMYPSDQIIEILFNFNVPVTLGSDAHTSDRVGYRFDEAVGKLRKAGYRKISGFSKESGTTYLCDECYDIHSSFKPPLSPAGGTSKLTTQRKTPSRGDGRLKKNASVFF